MWVKASSCLIAELPAEQCHVLAVGPWLTPYKPDIAVQLKCKFNSSGGQKYVVNFSNSALT